MKLLKRRLALAFLLCMVIFCMVPVQAQGKVQLADQAGQTEENAQQAGQTEEKVQLADQAGQTEEKVQLADQAGQTEENAQLTDQAGLLSVTEAKEVERRLAELEGRTGWEFMALTTDDAGGEDATSYAESWFDRYTANDDGVICAIDMDNREIVVRAFGEARYYITDNRTERILDAGYEAVSEEKYAATLQAMLDEVEDAYQNENASKNYLQDEDTGEVIRHPRKKSITLSEILIALGLAVAAGGGAICGIFGKYRLKFGGYKYPIEKNGRVNLTAKEDRLVNSFVTRRHIPKQTGSSGGGSRSTVHTGSGGRSSSGGSRKF